MRRFLRRNYLALECSGGLREFFSRKDAKGTKETRKAFTTCWESALLLQICVIAAAAQIFGRVFPEAGQPTVVGEMTALFGWIAPQLSQRLFPVGMTLNVGHLREQSPSRFRSFPDLRWRYFLRCA